jgi:peptidoglycan hydrolase-like protein with peptidoglycan-binding domain
MATVSPLGHGERLGTGDEGEQVGELQRWLQHLGYYHGDVDQRFGDVTEWALREFQRATGRPDDGAVDVETWESLDRDAQSAGYDPYAQDSVQDSAASQADGADESAGQLSEDGQWRWDGSEWQPVAQEPGADTAAERHVSEDGQWWWDGSQWQPVAGDAAPAGAKDDEKRVITINEAIDDPTTEEAVLG